MRRNTIFEEYIKNKQTCQVHGYDGVIGRDKDHLLGKLVDYNCYN